MENGIGLALARLCGAYRQRMETALREIGLHVGQEQALRFLWAEQGITQGQLMERMGCTAATISNMLDRLEKNVFIERRPSPADARSQCIFLTEAGTAIESLVRETWAREEARLTTDLTPEECVLLQRLLVQVRRNFD